MDKVRTERTASYKKKSSTIDARSLTRHRRILEIKQKRETEQNVRRPTLSSVTEEISPANTPTAEPHRGPGRRNNAAPAEKAAPVNDRRAALQKWKAERDLKRKLEAEQKAKKKPFKVSVVTSSTMKSTSGQIPSLTHQTKRSTRATTSKTTTVAPTAKPLKVDKPSENTRGRVTRSKTAVSSQAPQNKPQAVSKPRQTRAAADTAAPRTSTRTTRSASVKDVKTTTAPGRQTRSRSKGPKNTPAAAQPSVESTEGTTKLSTSRRVTRSKSKGRQSPERTEKAPSEEEMEIEDSTKPGREDSDKEASGSSSDESRPKPLTTSTPFVRTMSRRAALSSDEDTMFSGVNEKFISSQRGETSFLRASDASFAPSNFEFKPPSNLSTLQFKPLSPSTTHSFLFPDHVFTPPVERAPRAASSKKKKTPMRKEYRNSLILATKSPEEGIEILKQSPMIEIKRRTPKQTKSPNPNNSLSELQQELALPTTLNFDEEPPTPAKDNFAPLDDIEEEMQTDSPVKHSDPEPPAPAVTDPQSPPVSVPRDSGAVDDPEADQSTITDLSLNPKPAEQPRDKSSANLNDPNQTNEPTAETAEEQQSEDASKPTPTTDNSTSSSQDQPTVEATEKPTEAASPKNNSPTEATTPVVHDVPYFRNLLKSEELNLNTVADKWDGIRENTPALPEDVQGQMRAVAGQARLLIVQRFKQFTGLVDNCEFGLGERETTCTDLQGFWDMIFMQVEDVNEKSEKLEQLKNNNWVSEEPKKVKKVLKKKPAASKPTAAAAKSKFAAFRAKLKQQESTADTSIASETLASQPPTLTVEEPAETKVFHAGFFQVNSPVQKSPRFHCEAGTPTKSERKSGQSPYFAGSVHDSTCSPQLKVPPQLDLSYVATPDEKPCCRSESGADSGSVPSREVDDAGTLASTPQRSVRTSAAAFTVPSSAVLSPLVSAEISDQPEQYLSAPSLFTPEEKSMNATPVRNRRRTRQSLRMLALDQSQNQTLPAAADDFGKYILPMGLQDPTGNQENTSLFPDSPGARRRSKSACQHPGSPLPRSRRTRVLSSPGSDVKKRRTSDLLFTPYQRMQTPARPATLDEEQPEPSINLMSFSPAQ